MENKNQYKDTGTQIEGTIPAPKPGLTKSPADRKVEVLEGQLAQQHKELLKLRRDISRLKDQVSEIAQAFNRRG